MFLQFIFKGVSFACPSSENGFITLHIKLCFAPLPVKLGRWEGIPFCPRCKTKRIVDEFHCILDCDAICDAICNLSGTS